MLGTYRDVDYFVKQQHLRSNEIKHKVLWKERTADQNHPCAGSQGCQLHGSAFCVTAQSLCEMLGVLGGSGGQSKTLSSPRHVSAMAQTCFLLYSLHGCTILASQMPMSFSVNQRYCQKGQEAQGNAKDLLVLEVVLALFVTNWNKHMSRKG